MACICISLVPSALYPIRPWYDLSFISSSAEPLHTALGRALPKPSAWWTTSASGLSPKACIEGWAMTSAHFFFTSPIPSNTTSRGHSANGQIAAQLQTDLFSWALVNGEFCYVHQARPWEYCGGPYWSTPSSAGWVFCVLILPDLSILVFLLWTVPPSPQSAFGLPAHKMKG